MKLHFKALIITVISISSLSVHAQEWNIGAHLNPAVTIPHVEALKTNDPNIKTQPVRLNYNLGFNGTYSYKKLNIEFALSYQKRSVRFQQNMMDPYYGGQLFYNVRFVHSSFELPILFGYKIAHYKGKSPNDVYLQFGASYESRNAPVAYSSTNSNGVVTITAIPTYTYDNRKLSIANVVGGFKFRTLFKKFGLMEYGATYHYPFRTNWYSISTNVLSTSGGAHNYSGTFYPHLGFFDIKIAYYFLNLDKHFRHLNYHRYGKEFKPAE